MRNTGTLYCIVADPRMARTARPDVGCYSPKELAAKENVTTTSVYSWIDQGLPIMRTGRKGNIRIYYQDFIQWMIDCATDERPVRDIPSWAFRFVKAATPKRANFAQKAVPGAVSVGDPSFCSGEKENDFRAPENAKGGAIVWHTDLFSCQDAVDGGRHE